VNGVDLTLYLVTDSALCGERGVLETVRAALPGGVTAVQVREPGATTRELCALSRAVHEVLAGTGVPLIVNDRLDVALAVGAEGVHLGQSDLDPADARRLGGAGLLIGLSVSTPEQVAHAAARPAGTLDYLGVGPVHATTTKPEAAAPLGLDGTRQLVAASPLPCVAIGGVGPQNAAASGFVAVACTGPTPR
jgi:thiamine-phosphate pyrophosphorylase